MSKSAYEIDSQVDKIERYVIVAWVDNEAGVLARLSGLFSGRGYNIESLAVAQVDEVRKISRITIATNGNGIAFGDLTTATASFTSSGGASSPTRCVFFGRHVPNTYTNTIDYVQIMSTGDAIDFGDLVGGVRNRIGTCSNGHGGL